MTSPYAVLPARRPDLRVGVEIRDAVERFGPEAVAPIVRDAVRRSVTGRASTREEVRLLREFVDVETEDAVAYWTARVTGGTPADSPEEVAPGGPEEPEEPAEAALLTCTSCGRLFGRPAASRGRPRTRCYSCSPERPRR